MHSIPGILKRTILLSEGKVCIIHVVRGGAVLCTVASQQEGPEVPGWGNREAGTGTFCVEFECSSQHRFPLGALASLHSPKT